MKKVEIRDKSNKRNIYCKTVAENGVATVGCSLLRKTKYSVFKQTEHYSHPTPCPNKK